MSTGDFMLILKGLKRGSLVQFDRGSIRKLERFVADHRERFDDMQPMLIELKACEKIYRDSVPDVTHNFVRLFYSRRLWATMLDSAVAGWQVKILSMRPARKSWREADSRLSLLRSWVCCRFWALFFSG